MNPKDGFDFNEMLWSFLDQSRRWGQEIRTLSPFTVSLATLYRLFLDAKGLHAYRVFLGTTTKSVSLASLARQ